LSTLSALETLISSCSACQAWVYSKLPGTGQTSFLRFLSSRHGFYDGTRSYAPQHVAFCPWGALNQFFCTFPAGNGPQFTVHAYFLANSPDAVSQTPVNPPNGPQVYFNPATGICNVLSVPNPSAGDQGVLNQATLFHEALHGYTGKFDTSASNDSLEAAFSVGEPSANVTYYLEDHVIFVTGTGARSCGN
jgi:hypothetical protein